MKNFIIILAALLVIALPFLFRREADSGSWEPGDLDRILGIYF